MINDNDNEMYDAQYNIADDLGENKEQIVKKLIENRDKLLNSYRNNKSKSVVKSSLYGFAIGDAFGVPVEGTGRDELKENPINDIIGFGKHNVPEGTWSDDTAMTLATMDSISQKDCIDYDDMMSKFCKWFYYGDYTTDGKVFDIGFSTRKALNMYKITNLPAIQCGSANENDNGNGSLMRILPVILYLRNLDIKEDEKVNIINTVSSLTHANEISKLGCYIYNVFISNILDGKTKEEAYLETRKYDYSKYYSKEALKEYSMLLTHDIRNYNEETLKSSGYVVDTLETAIWVILNTNNYEDSIVKAVNLGGDTDTIGAITGSISGILYGYDNIPKKWLDKLKNKDYLEEIISKYEKLFKKEDIIFKEKDNQNISMKDDYKYYKFVGGRYFRVSADESVFEVINENGEWVSDNALFFLYIEPGVEYDEITDQEKLNELMNLPVNREGRRKK